MKRSINKQKCEAVLMARAGKFRFIWQGESGRARFEFYRNGQLVAETEKGVFNGVSDETAPMAELTEGLYDIKIYSAIEQKLWQVLKNVRVGRPYEITVDKEAARDYGTDGTQAAIRIHYGKREELKKLHFYYRVRGVKYCVPTEYWDGFFVKGIPPRELRIECEENEFCLNLTCKIG